MRLDKYLKVSRLIKRRTVANDACDSARVMVNGRDAKASYQVKLGDVIVIAFGNRVLHVEVTDITVNGLSSYFEVRNDKKKKKNGAIINLGHATTIISIFEKGKLVKYDIFPSVINSRKQMTYSKVNEILEELETHFNICRITDKNKNIIIVF